MQPKADSWMEARENCQSLGGDLVSITNELELSFFADLQRRSKDVGGVWLGLNDSLGLWEFEV